VIVDSTITIGWDELSRRKRERLYRALSFVNKNGDLWYCYREFPNDRIEIPRGAWHLVEQLDYTDNRVRPKAPKLNFNGELDRIDLDPRFKGQSKCVETMLYEEQGLIIRPPGTGKTKIALSFAAQCQTPTLVLVHTKDILDQWIENARESLGIKIGVIQGQTVKCRQVTIAMVQSLRRFLSVPAFWARWGALILDEAHHGAAVSFETLLNHSPAFYRFGFTAMNTRADGMEPYVKHVIGPVIHKQKFSTPIKTTVEPVYSKFQFQYRGRWDWTPLLNELVVNRERNTQIANIIDREVRGGNSVLVLSRRIEQLERIADCCSSETAILTGDIRRDERQRILAEFRAGRIGSLLATQLADEALDVPRCNRIILTHPGKHDGRITQQVGRAIRKFEGKQDAIIYDVVDKRVRPLARQWRERKFAYGKMKIPIKKKILGGRNGR
jgi:superfamily II DNA or RNA helicase